MPSDAGPAFPEGRWHVGTSPGTHSPCPSPARRPLGSAAHGSRPRAVRPPSREEAGGTGRARRTTGAPHPPPHPGRSLALTLCLPPQGQLQIPLLRPADQGQLAPAATDGGPAAHGHAGPALLTEAEVAGRGGPARAGGGGAGLAGLSQGPNRPLCRLKPLQKMEGMTNGVAVGPQQAAGLSDISAQVQQYQQFLGESVLARGAGSGAGPRPPGSMHMVPLSPRPRRRASPSPTACGVGGGGPCWGGG